MVKILIGNKNTTELDILSQNLTNDKKFKVANVTNGNEVLHTYLKTKPDILILDNSVSDMTIEDIINRLSASPIERKKCNTVLILPYNYNVKFKRYEKICEIVYKPFSTAEINNIINELSIDYNTPDLDVGEVDWLLQSLNFNCLSVGYRYMRDAITYCYYKPDELEFLNNILKYLAYQYNTNESKIRDSMNACIRPFNNSASYGCTKELFNILYNNGNKLSLKDFLERIVLYLIRVKNKGRVP